MSHPFNPQETPVGLSGSASKTIAIKAGAINDTSDTVDLPGGTARGLLVGTAGAATILDASGSTTSRLLVPLQAGFNPIAVKRVFSTNLTADNIWALY